MFDYDYTKGTLQENVEVLVKVSAIKDRMLLNIDPRKQDATLEAWLKVFLPKLKAHIHSQVDDI